MRSPQSLTITEANFANVTQFNVLTRKASDSSVLASRNYPPVGANTVCPVGSDGYLDNVHDGESVNFSVIEHNALGAGPEFVVPGGSFTIGTYPGAPSTVTVQL